MFFQKPGQESQINKLWTAIKSTRRHSSAVKYETSAVPKGNQGEGNPQVCSFLLEVWPNREQRRRESEGHHFVFQTEHSQNLDEQHQRGIPNKVSCINVLNSERD